MAATGLAPGTNASCVTASARTGVSPFGSSNRSSAPKKNSLSLTIGPPADPPYSQRSNDGLSAPRFWKKSFAARSWSR
jgi:hypothetical protein